MDLIGKHQLNDPECKFRLNKTELIIASFAANLLSLALPIMVLQVYDRIMINYSYDTLVILSLVVCGAICLESVIRIIRSYATGWAGMMYEYTLDANATRKYINADPIKIKQEGTGKQMQNLNSFTKMKDFYSGQSLVSMVDIPFALIFLCLIWYIAGPLVLVPIILISIFCFISWRSGKKLVRALKDQDQNDDEKYNFMIESLQGIHSIKSYGLEHIFQRRFERLEEKSTLSSYDVSIASTKGSAFSSLFNEVMIVAVVAFGAPMVIDQNLTTGALIAIVLLSGRLIQPISKSLFLWTQYQDYKIANEKADELFSISQMKRDPDLSHQDQLGDLVIENINFEYGDRQLFNNLSLIAKTPDVIGIHGPNNSGKSTLLKLMAGIMQPSSGSITIDGIQADCLTSEELVRHVGLIEPDNVIFQGTIIENMTAFDDTKEDKAMSIAKLLHLDHEVSSLPHGYRTKINDGFVDTVAPGVKQKIAITRVLLNNPKIILFNNADKGLDKAGYECLIKLLEMLKGKVTIIMLTEDKRISQLASKHYALKEGSLTEITQEDSDNIFEVKSYKELKI
ncbi:MAG: hypothetical protein DGJ47_000280 [Rickettsiaceae bacterium]